MWYHKYQHQWYTTLSRQSDPKIYHYEYLIGQLLEFLAIFIPIMGNLDNYWNNRTQLPSNYQRYTTVSKHLDTKKYQNGYLIGQLLRFSSILRSVSLKQTACHLRCRERSGDKTRASSSPCAGEMRSSFPP